MTRPETRPAEARVARAWAVIALDPSRAHHFGRRPDGRAISRCGTAASSSPLLVKRRAERLCPACVVDLIQELFV